MLLQVSVRLIAIGLLSSIPFYAAGSEAASNSSFIPIQLGTIKSDTDHTLFGRQILPLGDRNGDGYDDLLTWDYRFRAYIYHGGPTPQSVPVLSLDSIQRLSLLPDLNSDSYPEICGLGRTNRGWKNGVFYGGPQMDTTRDLWFGLDTPSCVSYAVVTNDINQDGSNEIISQSEAYDELLVCELSPPDSVHDWAIRPANLTENIDYVSFGESIIAADYNGDGTTDLLASLRRRDNVLPLKPGALYLYFGGPQFDTVPDMIINRPGGYVDGGYQFGCETFPVGDLNGDGFEDIFAHASRAVKDTLCFLFFAGPLLDTIPDLVFYRSILRSRYAGDLNNDGYDDFIASYGLPFSGFGHVYIFFGGPDIDTIPDVTIRNQDMPQYQVEFGLDCTGIGDFNNDGFDDFAFSAIPSDDRGEIYIFSGWQGGTSVDDESEVPLTFQLEQNYPNPFNPSTTIEFTTRSRGPVQLEIYNVVGAKVRMLLDRLMPPGSHRVEWDGHDDSDRRCASGVYFYRVTAGDEKVSRKMLLLK